jgi:hypothetical protein
MVSEASFVTMNSDSPYLMVAIPTESYPLFFNNSIPSKTMVSALFFVETIPIIPQQEAFSYFC